MSRKKNGTYNRKTSQYRKNLYRGELNRAGVKPPKMRNNTRLKKIAIILAAIWIILAIAAILISREIALLVLLTGVVGAAALVLYYTNEDRKIVETYIKLGLTKEQFNEALVKRRTDPRQIMRINKIWDRAEEKLTKQ